MQKKDLQFSYPEELVATSPVRPSRVLLCDSEKNPQEISIAELLLKPSPGDVWVVNDTKVLKRRVFAGELEILFLKERAPREWEVLFPSRGLKVGSQISLPDGVVLELIEKGRPQIVRANRDLDFSFFESFGEVPLPPYIQKARSERHSQIEDDSWYQTFWAQKAGSLAAPTASLHFQPEDFELLRSRGVQIASLTLHVGLGTFLPVTSENLNEHQMHHEEVEIPRQTWNQILAAKEKGHRVWALGTTVARSLESVFTGHFKETPAGYEGHTNLFILPGFEWKVVDTLMTNFHQPESTLLALVASFSDLESVRRAYQFAIDKKFRLFSYGDLSVWNK